METNLGIFKGRLCRIPLIIVYRKGGVIGSQVGL